MCQDKNTTKRKKYKQFSEIQRYKLEGYLDPGLSIAEISNLLNKCQSSIRGEIRKGTVELKDSLWKTYKKYCADVAQRITDERKLNKGPGLKIGNDHELAAEIERLIGEKKSSPDAAVMEIGKSKKRYKTTVCTKTVYNYIYAGLFLNIDKSNLVVESKKKGKARKRKNSTKNLRGKRIEDRKEIVNSRKEYGHQEMDLVVGKKSTKAVLLVFTERKTLHEIIRKIPNKTQESVRKAIDTLEIELGEAFSKRFKTVTSDNGSEFLDYESLEKSAIHKGTRFELYYAHPYSSYERGSNENANKLIRRFIPKGADISKYSEEDIARVERWINNYPRRKFGGKSSNEMIA